ncbi:MAG: ABC transporter permease [Phycisphaeraceae bacterium]|nr:ABC transporter permease [Phycisphaeraceae bacterium]
MSAPGIGMVAAGSLALREVRRLRRQPLRIAVAIATPAMMWLFIASGFAGSVRPESLGGEGGEGGSMALYLLPGMASLVVLFNAIFASISLIEDRHQGFLQAVLVSPAPRWAMAAGKLVGGGVLGFAQSLVLLAFSPLVGASPGVTGVLAAALALACLSLGITGLGLAAAWRVDSASGFHGVMNLVLMPMWLLSGAIFPVEGASGWLRAIVVVNPLAWCQRAVGAGLAGHADAAAIGLSCLFAGGGVALAFLTIGRAARARAPDLLATNHSTTNDPER